ISGTHGLEGLAGAGCQIGWLQSEDALSPPPDTAILIIHMLNPWGVAWHRRQTEVNVDLNRNFLDFKKLLPDNPNYTALMSALNCPEWTGPTRDAAEAEITRYRDTEGEKAFACAVFQGQHEDPDGIGFNGLAPTWSNRTLHEI